MATVIDALLVTLGLDASGIQKGQRDATEALGKTQEAARKAALEMETRGKQAALFYKNIRNEALGLFAAITGGKALTEFYGEVTNTDAATGRLARNIGMSVENFTAWQNAARNMGGSAEATGGSLQNLVQQFQMLALTGQSAVVPYFRALGVTIADATGKMRPMNDVLFDLADRFSHMNPTTAVTIGKAIGLDEGTINLLIRGRQAVQSMLAEQEKLGHANAEDAAAAQERQTALRQMTQASEDLGRKLLTEATPAILSLLEALKGVAEWGGRHRETVTVVFSALAAGITGISVAIAAGAVSGLIALAGAAGTALTVITALSAAVAAFAVAKAAMDDNNQDLADQHDWNKLEASLRMQHPEFSDADIEGLMQEERAKAPRLPSKQPERQKAAEAPRGIRNNNPGNLEYHGQAGATSDGRYARFNSMAQGVAALADQLRLYGQRGNDTIAGIVSTFAPPKKNGVTENNTQAYIEYMSKKLGVGANAHLMVNDPATMKALIEGITSYENGPGKVSLDQINQGLAMRGVTNNSTAHTETHVGTINVNTQATDAKGVARGIGQALENYSMAAQANYSLN
jgi:hypothetical protein